MSNNTEPYVHCSICSNLAAEETAFQKYGWEEENTYLPAAAFKLTVVKDFKPFSYDRQLQLWQCLKCGTFYLYRTDYEFLVTGSEDEEYLTRLSSEEAEEYLKRPVRKHGIRDSMQWDTPENYERRRKRLKEQIEAALRDIPEEGPLTEEQVEHLRYLVAEKSELLHWDVYNDLFSRADRWLFNNYLHLHSNEARLAILAFRADPSLRRSELGVAFEEYLNMIRHDRIRDDYVAAWMKKHGSEPSG